MADTSTTAGPPQGATRAAPPPTFLLALTAVGLITLWRLVVLFGDPFNLSFDEAQYWAWAQDPAFGYFSKPPMVAWVIALTTSIGGDGEAWVRLGSTFAHFGTALTLFFIGRTLYGPRVGLWSSVVYATLPGVAVSSLIISTDPFLLLFWALALHAYIQARRTAVGPGGLGWWAMLGLWIGLGLLSKYAMVFFLLSMAAHLLWSREDRRWLRAPGPWLATGLGVLLYLPNLWWNWANGFVSYHHTGENANLEAELFNPGELLEFLGSQFGVFGPLLFGALLVLLLARLGAAARDGRHRLLIAFTVPVLMLIAFQAFLSRANANWAATAYVAASVLVVGWLFAHGRWRFLVHASVVLHLTLAAAAYDLQGTARLLGVELTARTDLLKRVRGWEQVGAWVRELKAAHPDLRLLFDDRKVMATLLYYARPAAFEGVMWNPTPSIQNHYELTTSMQGLEGRDFLFITRNEDHIRPYFEATEVLGVLRIPVHPDYTLQVRAYRASGFKGYAAP